MSAPIVTKSKFSCLVSRLDRGDTTRLHARSAAFGLALSLAALACQTPASDGTPRTTDADPGRLSAPLSVTTTTTAQTSIQDSKRLAFELAVGDRHIELSLQLVAAPTAAAYHNYGVDAAGRLVDRPTTLDSCHYQGTATTIEANGSESQGFASLDLCPTSTGYPTGQAIRGVFVLGDQLWDVVPVADDSDPSDDVAHTLRPSRRGGVPSDTAGTNASPPQIVEVLPLPISSPVTLEFREGTAVETKYIELVLVNDAARSAQRGARTEADGLALIQAANAMLRDSGLVPRVRIVLAAQVTFDSDPFPLFSGALDNQGDPVPLEAGQEVDHALQLDSFLDWALNSDLPPHDEHLLLSGLDFLSNSAGLAPVAAACLSGQNGFLVQADPIDPSSGIGFSVLSTVHELGHTLGMDHDPNSAACRDLEHIMSAVGCADCPLGGLGFSPCSQADFTNYLNSYDYLITSCADDLPAAPGFAACGDGVVSAGETCDCGSDNCQGIDPCCDGASCQLVAGATCSDYNDTCCSECGVIPAAANVLCRAQRSECDTEERCTGVSPNCPVDSFLQAGEACQDAADNEGVCYFGDCRSRTPQCEQLGVLLSQQNPDFNEDLTAPLETCQAGCDIVICSGEAGSSLGCVQVNGTAVAEGVSCAGGQCVDGDCVALVDQCPDDDSKTAPGECGCGIVDEDTDFDGTLNCLDGCPDDRNKQQAGVCGCGVADSDVDDDGLADCVDDCPYDADKQAVGVCGCGTPDTDSDTDGTPNCQDDCPTQPGKSSPGQCGCDTADTDTDDDGTADCNDACPNDANTTEAPCSAAAGEPNGSDDPSDPDDRVAVTITSDGGICSVSAPGSSTPHGSTAWLLLTGSLLLQRRRRSAAPRPRQ